MKPCIPKMPKREVIHRKVMHAIADRVKTWDEHATIISCRFQTGKTVAVEENPSWCTGNLLQARCEG